MLNDIKFFLSFFCLVFLLHSNQLYAITIKPDKINFGYTKKDEVYKYYIKLENNTDKNIYILGVINDCGVDLNIKNKNIKPLKYVEGVLTFNSGTSPGHFVQNIKVLYKFENEEQIRKKNIEVRWFNQPESYSKIFLLSENIKLNIPLKRQGDFFIEAVNVGNKEGQLLLTSKIDGFYIQLPTTIPANKNIFIKGRILPEAEITGNKRIIIETRDITTSPFIVNVSYTKKNDIMINFGEFLFKDDKVYLPIHFDNFNLLNHPFEIENVNGEKLNFEEKILSKGDNAQGFLVVEKKDFEKLKNSFFYLKIGIKLPAD